MYTSNTDISSLKTSILMWRIVNDNGTPDSEDRSNAVDHIRQNAVVREFVYKLMLSRKRVSQELAQLSKDIR